MRKAVAVLNHYFHASSQEKAPSDDKLLYFYFDEDRKPPGPENDKVKNAASLPRTGHGSSKLLEFVTFYENLNIILDDVRINREMSKAAHRHHKVADSLQAVIDLIILAMKPEKIYQVNYPVLAGNEISQFTDLVIIIGDNCQEPFRKIEPFLELVTIKHRQVCCTLVKSEKLFQSLGRGDFYLSLACNSHNLVYNCIDGEDLPDLNEEKIKNIKTEAEYIFYSYLSKSEKFLEAGRQLRDDPNDGIFLFMLHQALELILRGILLAFSGMDKRTHEIRVLLKHTCKFAPKINEILPAYTDEEKYLLQCFDEAYLKSRYQADYSPEPYLKDVLHPRVEQALQAARDTFRITLDHL